MVWRVLADECRLTVNPWDRIQKHKLNSLATRKRALTPAQFDSLLAAQYEHDPSKISKDISAAFEKAGMETTEARADRGRVVVVFGAHSLRHFFVTQATAAGMPDAMIKSITGHGSDGMLEHYQQIGIDLAADMAGRIQGTAAATLAGGPPPLLADATGDPLEALRGRIMGLAEGITAKTWKTAREELLTLAPKLRTEDF